MKNYDKEAIEDRGKELLIRYEQGGIESLRNFISSNENLVRNQSLFLRVTDTSNVSLYEHLPIDAERFHFAEFKKTNLSPAKNVQWIVIPALDDEDTIEVAIFTTKDGHLLQVGKSTEMREEHIERFQEVFMMILLPYLAIAIFSGLLISSRGLKPIRNLVSTIKDLQQGNISARVQVNNSGDELDELSKMFNDLLGKNETLITGMQNSLDNIAHDLKTPITRFRCSAELAIRGVLSEEGLRTGLIDAVENSDQILSLINTLMDISEAQSQAIKLKKERIDINRIVEDAIDLYAVVAEEKNIQITDEFEKNLFVLGDVIRLRQVFANLLDNAIKYTAPGGVISIRTQATDGHVKVTMQDSGIGIDKEEIDLIWDRLYRGDRSRSQRGLGLGLSLVKAIVLAHDGTVHVESRINDGSSFSVVLAQAT
jgi:signal transduction histidine kinase